MEKKLFLGAANILLLLSLILFLLIKLIVQKSNYLSIISITLISAIFILIIMKNYLQDNKIKYNINSFVCCLLNILLLYILYFKL